MKRETDSKNIYSILTAVFIMIALSCAVVLLADKYKRWKAEDIFRKLAQSTVAEPVIEPVKKPIPESVIPEDAMLTKYELKVRMLYEKYGVVVPEKNIDFDNLHNTVSEDIYAWIYLPNTNIDYPVLQHPTDNAYYLEHNLDGSEGYPGCIYTENYNSKDFTDPQTVVYGHNMRDGTMFSDLHKYEDEDFFNENKYVFFHTEDDVFAYRIFAAYQTDNLHQLLNYNFADNEVFLRYIAHIFEIESDPQILDRDVKYDENSRLLTMSTCVMKERQFHLRYLVQAFLVD